jgi:hypothetical protein
VPDSAAADARDGSCATPAVSCPTLIDASKLTGYTDTNASSLAALCKTNGLVANSQSNTVAIITNAAQALYPPKTWVASNSQQWFTGVSSSLGQRDVTALINNCVIAGQALLRALNQQSFFDKATFAYMMEAAVLSTDAQWIITNTNKYVQSGTPQQYAAQSVAAQGNQKNGKPPQRANQGVGERAYVTYINGLTGNRMHGWYKYVY